MHPGHEVGGHAQVSAPDVVETRLPQGFEHGLQAPADAFPQSRPRSGGDHQRAAGDQSVAGVVTREVQFTVGVRHGVTKRKDLASCIV